MENFEAALPEPDSDEIRSLFGNRETFEAYRFLYERRSGPLPTMAEWVDRSAAVLGKANVHTQRRLREVREHFVVETVREGGQWVYRLRGRRDRAADGAANGIDPVWQARVFHTKGRFCQMCGRGPSDGVRLRVVHVVPPEFGGGTSIDNLEPLCADHAVGNAAFFRDLAPYASAIKRALRYETSWERVGELLRAMRDAGQHVPAELLSVVVRDETKGDPARRLRDLRVVLGWDIRAHKRKVGRTTKVEYELVSDRPWPPEGAREAVNAYERDRKRRKSQEARRDGDGPSA